MAKKKATKEKTADSTKNASTTQRKTADGKSETIRTRITGPHRQSPWWIGEVYDLTPHDRAWADERGIAEDAD